VFSSPPRPQATLPSDRTIDGFSEAPIRLPMSAVQWCGAPIDSLRCEAVTGITASPPVPEVSCSPPSVGRKGTTVHTVEMTFGRALKVWWSYAWRTFVLLFPVMMVAMPLMFVLMPHPHPGEKPDPSQIRAAMPRFFVIWLVMMAANVLVQVQAMRWMLRTKWSDFRLAATND
jgi:hypothetical protein